MSYKSYYILLLPYFLAVHDYDVHRFYFYLLPYACLDVRLILKIFIYSGSVIELYNERRAF